MKVQLQVSRTSLLAREFPSEVPFGPVILNCFSRSPCWMSGSYDPSDGGGLVRSASLRNRVPRASAAPEQRLDVAFQWRAGHQYIVGGLANRAFCYRIIGASQPGASTVHALIAPAREPNLSREIAHKRPNHLKLQLREGLEAPSPPARPRRRGRVESSLCWRNTPGFRGPRRSDWGAGGRGGKGDLWPR